MSKIKTGIVVGMAFAIGVIVGGYLFSESQPRSILALPDCQNCLSPAGAAGLIASVGIQKFPGAMPLVVAETEKTFVIQHPAPSARIHYVAIPKKDIKNIGSVADEDMAYSTDAYAVMRGIINQQNLKNYRISALLI